MSKEKHSQPWFKQARWSYIFINGKGALCYIPFIAYLVFSTIIAHHHATSTADLIFQLVPQWVAAAVVMEWFASHKT